MSDPTYRLLLELAGRVDDDLLATGRELVAVGEEGHALELLVAELTAGRVELPDAMRRELVAEAAARRVQPDAERCLSRGAGEAPEHRFTGTGPDGPAIAAAVAAVPELADGALAWRTTPAGAAPGALPHPVLLARAGDGGSAEVVTYRGQAALARAGLVASVEVQGVDDPHPGYHRTARAASVPVRSLTRAGDAAAAARPPGDADDRSGPVTDPAADTPPSGVPAVPAPSGRPDGDPSGSDAAATTGDPLPPGSATAGPPGSAPDGGRGASAALPIGGPDDAAARPGPSDAPSDGSASPPGPAEEAPPSTVASPPGPAEEAPPPVSPPGPAGEAPPPGPADAARAGPDPSTAAGPDGDAAASPSADVEPAPAGDLPASTGAGPAPGAGTFDDDGPATRPVPAHDPTGPGPDGGDHPTHPAPRPSPPIRALREAAPPPTPASEWFETPATTVPSGNGVHDAHRNGSAPVAPRSGSPAVPAPDEDAWTRDWASGAWAGDVPAGPPAGGAVHPGGDTAGEPNPQGAGTDAPTPPPGVPIVRAPAPPPGSTDGSRRPRHLLLGGDAGTIGEEATGTATPAGLDAVPDPHPDRPDTLADRLTPTEQQLLARLHVELEARETAGEPTPRNGTARPPRPGPVA